MMLFHGSNRVVEYPRADAARANLDFGRGFYATTHRAHAENWALRKALRSRGEPTVNVYEFDASRPLATKTFPENDEAWVEFVCACRKGSDAYAAYDLVIGGVADDKVFRAVDMYLRGSWDLQTTLDALVFYERTDQYCFVSQVAIDSALTFVESYEVRR